MLVSLSCKCFGKVFLNSPYDNIWSIRRYFHSECLQRHAEACRGIQENKNVSRLLSSKGKSGELIVQIQKHIIHMSISEAKVIFKYPSISSYQQWLDHPVCQSIKMHHPIIIRPYSPEPFTISWWRWWWWRSSQGTHRTVTKVLVRYIKHFTCCWQ